MDNNTVGILIFIVIIAVLISFALGYYYAMNRTENRFFNAQIKLTEAKINTMKQLENLKVIDVRQREMPKELREMLDNIMKEIEEEDEKSKKD